MTFDVEPVGAFQEFVDQNQGLDPIEARARWQAAAELSRSAIAATIGVSTEQLHQMSNSEVIERRIQLLPNN